MNEKEIIAKALEEKWLTEDEVRYLLDDMDYAYVGKKVYGDDSRWTRDVTVIFTTADCPEGVYIALGYDEGLTEEQENYYPAQEASVVRVVRRCYTVFCDDYVTKNGRTVASVETRRV